MFPSLRKDVNVHQVATTASSCVQPMQANGFCSFDDDNEGAVITCWSCSTFNGPTAAGLHKNFCITKLDVNIFFRNLSGEPVGSINVMCQSERTNEQRNVLYPKLFITTSMKRHYPEKPLDKETRHSLHLRAKLNFPKN